MTDRIKSTDKIADHITENTTDLTDETLDTVDGGWSWGGGFAETITASKSTDMLFEMPTRGGLAETITARGTNDFIANGGGLGFMTKK